MARHARFLHKSAVLRLVNVGTNEGIAIVRRGHTRQMIDEHRLGHADGHLELSFQDLRLRRKEARRRWTYAWSSRLSFSQRTVIEPPSSFSSTMLSSRTSASRAATSKRPSADVHVRTGSA